MAGGRRNQVWLGTLALASGGGDAGCLRFALLSIGVHIGMGYIWIAYIASTLAGLVPILPGGLGLVEATVPGVLHYYGVPLDRAVAGTLLWRAISLLLPSVVGALAYGSLRIGSRRVARLTRAAGTGAS